MSINYTATISINYTTVNSSQSNWMAGPSFLIVLELVKKHTRSSKEDCQLLLMDNRESHCTLDSILYAIENGITLVIFFFIAVINYSHFV
jgi:hypothetical protein